MINSQRHIEFKREQLQRCYKEGGAYLACCDESDTYTPSRLAFPRPLGGWYVFFIREPAFSDWSICTDEQVLELVCRNRGSCVYSIEDLVQLCANKEKSPETTATPPLLPAPSESTTDDLPGGHPTSL